MFSAALYAPFSQGTVALTNAAPEAPPAIDFRFLDDPRDAPRILQAARFAESLLADPLFRQHYHDAFLLPPVMSLNQFGKTGLAGALTALGASLVLNAPPPISRLVLSRRLAPGFWIANAGTSGC